MRVALYCRVSTGDQIPENQLIVLRQWAASQGHLVAGEYVDYASGVKRRERLDDMFNDARHRHFDLLAIWSLDRLTRQGPLATLLYIQRLASLGVKVWSHQEPYLDPKLPFYESIIAFLADIARWERERLSERTKAGLQRAVAGGKTLGRPPGSGDTKRRKSSGYFLREANKREKQ